MILCDTGALLCLVDRNQKERRAYVAAFRRLDKPMVITWACLAEAMYLALGKGGWRMQKQLADFLMSGFLVIFEITEGDYARLFDLMEKYQDRPMDLADATLVLAAESTDENRILTIDSDFRFYRINGRKNFEIIGV